VPCSRPGDRLAAVNPKLDALIDSAAVEPDQESRRVMIREALANAQVHHVPLHRQMIPWAMRSNVNVVHRPDNAVNLSTTKLD
jgi:peptide/nickel transport system substrate-binding protein